MKKSKFLISILVLFASAGLLLFMLQKEPAEKNNGSILRDPKLEDNIILQGVRSLEVLPVSYPSDLDFGKGKLALFELAVPSGLGPFRIDTIKARLDGTTGHEVPQLWLRFNSVRVYTKTLVAGGGATFTAFPPLLGTGSVTPDSLPDIPSLRLENTQETQLLIESNEPLPQELPAGAVVSIGIYGKWFPDIIPREPENGFRLCLEHISGTFRESGQRGVTSLAAPLCWNSMGIASPQQEHTIPSKPYVSFLTAEGGINVPMELAETDAARSHGLADRDELSHTQGMLFVWGKNNSTALFTMTGMRFALDIIFIEERDGKFSVQHIANNLPPCPKRQSCTLAYPTDPYRYVVEVNGGFTEQHGIRTGDPVKIVP